MKALKTFALLPLAYGAVACGPQTTPLERVDGQPAPVNILGASYTVPPRLDVPDYKSEPGHVHFTFVDNLTRCQGGMFFNKTGLDTHKEIVEGLNDSRAQAFEGGNVVVTRKTEPFQVWAKEGQLTVTNLEANSEVMRHVVMDLHHEENNLSVIGEVFCDDADLMDEELTALQDFLGTANLTVEAAPVPVAEPTEDDEATEGEEAEGEAAEGEADRAERVSADEEAAAE